MSVEHCPQQGPEYQILKEMNFASLVHLLASYKDVPEHIRQADQEFIQAIRAEIQARKPEQGGK